MHLRVPASRTPPMKEERPLGVEAATSREINAMVQARMPSCGMK